MIEYLKSDADKSRHGIGTVRGRIIAVFVLFLLASCGMSKQALQPTLTEPVHRIELAMLEVDQILMIRQLNPIFMMMGSSGVLLDAARLSQNNNRYKEEAGPVRRMCEDLFRQTLMQNLSSLGYVVHASGKPYWDYFKPSQRAILAQTDAILRIRFKQVGFISKGLESDYVPSAYVYAELIHARTRKVLYSDRFAIGVGHSLMQMAAMSEGEIKPFALPGASVSYESLKDLLAHPEQSREALLGTTALAAMRVVEGFRGGSNRPVLMVYEPSIIEQPPAMPSFNAMRERMQR